VKKPTANSIIKAFLIKRVKTNDLYISSHHFEIDVPRYGKMFWGVTKLPSAYSREWRKIRESKDYKNVDIYEIKKVKTESPEATWKIIPEDI
tara:strand:- start:5918 stop:6193 length:276 start_codon:yes stop_codon:yes gene_type:complete